MKILFTYLVLSIIIFFPSAYLCSQPCDGYALRFDGKSQYIEISDQPEISAIGRNFTFQYWIRVTSYKEARIIGKWGKGSTDDDEYAANIFSDGSMEIAISGKNKQSSIYTNPIPKGEWVNVTHSLDYSNRMHSVYINGVLKHQSPAAFSMDRDTKQSLNIGTYDLKSYFAGDIEDVRLWNIALTPGYIDSTLHCKLKGDEPGLIGYWPMDEGSGTVVHDLSNNHNDGIFKGSPEWIKSDIISSIDIPSIKNAYFKCSNSTLTIDAGMGYTEYSWSNGNTTRTADFNKAGDYWIEVLSDCKCRAKKMFKVIDTTIVCNIAGDLSIYEGESTTLDAGDGYDSYLWTTGETSQTIVVKSTGSYSVFVKLGVNCDASDTVNVSVIPGDRCHPSSFDFKTFSDTNSIHLSGNAQLISNLIELTDFKKNRAGSIWVDSKVPVLKGFSTEFSFYLTNGTNYENIENSSPGADGITLVIQNSGLNQSCSIGGNIGYGGIQNGIAIEIDTFINKVFNDPDNDHIAVMVTDHFGVLSPNHADGLCLGTSTENIPQMTAYSMEKYYCKVDYSKEEEKLSVYLDKTGAFTTPALVIDKFDISKYIILSSKEYAYIGLTSATGNSAQRQMIASWKACFVNTSTILSVDGENSKVCAPILYSVPNPASNFISIKVPIESGLNGSMTYIVYSVMGEKMLESSTPEMIDVSGLAPGVYFLRAGEVMFKFVKI